MAEVVLGRDVVFQSREAYRWKLCLEVCGDLGFEVGAWPASVTVVFVNHSDVVYTPLRPVIVGRGEDTELGGWLYVSANREELFLAND